MNIVINDNQLKHIKLRESILNEISKEDIPLNSFELKNNLNDKLWGDNLTIKTNVRRRLLKIADDFIETTEINSKYIKDILLLGSSASYNWSKYSDIDLHILVDFKKINKNVNLIKDYFDSKKKLWNDEHNNLKIYNIPVELYVQDVDEENGADGVFSLDKNKWIKKPTLEKDNINIDKNTVKNKSMSLIKSIEDLENEFKKDKITQSLSNKIKNLWDKVKRIRKDGLATSKGEFSTGNLIFKVLRRTNYLEKLVDLKINVYDKLNSIK